MSKSSVITIRIDPDVKSQLEKLYASFGLNISDAINMFIHQSLLLKGLPFELRVPGFRGEMSMDDGSFSEEPWNCRSWDAATDDILAMRGGSAEIHDRMQS